MNQAITHVPVKTSLRPSPRRLKVFFQVHLLLSIFIGRNFPQKKATLSLLSLILSEEIIGFITDIEFNSLEFLAKSCMGDRADTLLNLVKNNFQIFNVGREQAESVALYNFTLNRFDTALLLACAEEKKANAIITETIEAFVNGSEIPLLTPEEFIRRYSFDEKKLLDYALAPNYISAVIPEPERLIAQDQELLEVKIFDDWCIERFEVHINAKEVTKAEVTLWNSSEGISISKGADGNGPVDALCKALALALYTAVPERPLPLPIVNHVFLESEQRGADSPVNAEVVVEFEETNFIGKFVNTDTVKAVFYAYVNAISQIPTASKLETEVVCQAGLSEQDLKKQYREGIRDFSMCLLSNLSLADFTCEGINLEGATINGSDLRRATLSSERHRAKLRGININVSELGKTKFESADLSFATIVGTNLSEADFSYATLNNADVRASELLKARMNKVSLINADLSSSYLCGAILDNAILTAANLTGVDLSEANLNQASFILAVLNKAILVRAKLTEANLTGTNFYKANLKNADLRAATLLGTNLAEANLSGADLTELDLTTANLKGAVLTNAKLNQAKLTLDQRNYLNLNGVDLKQVNIVESLSSVTLTFDLKSLWFGYDRIPETTAQA